MFGHVFDDLAAYAEQQLDDVKRARVEEHLAACGECQQSLRRIQQGITYAAELVPEPMPVNVAARIRRELAQRPSTSGADRSHPVVRWWHAAAATLIALTAIGLYWQLNRPWVQLHAASSAPTRFEQEGRALHDRIVAGQAPVAFATDDEQALWRWLSSRGAPVTSMVISRPDAERAQFIPVGAAVHTLDGTRASVISYRIDGQPVTLALADADRVRDAPAAGWWSKRVTHRQDANGVNILTWTVGGGTYVMVSELDGAGQKACLICHTAPRFREHIRKLQPPAPHPSSIR